VSKQIYYVTATKGSSTENTEFGKFIENSRVLNTKPEGREFTNNKKSLAKVYNEFIHESMDGSIVVFVHDDFLIEDMYIRQKLEAAFRVYDIVGLAGTTGPIQVQKPALWHLMAPRETYRGAVAHYTGKEGEERFMTPFGVTPSRVLLTDGVFLAVDVGRLLKKGVKFDESNPARFHYYDLDLCLQANKYGLRVGVWPIWGTHRSHGLSDMNDPEFLQGQEWFIKKWS